MKLSLGKILKFLFVALLVAGCAYILRPGFAKYTENRNEVERLETEIVELEAERAGLEAQMQALEEEDPELMERLAREKLHLGKPGEIVFRFKEEE